MAGATFGRAWAFVCALLLGIACGPRADRGDAGTELDAPPEDAFVSADAGPSELRMLAPMPASYVSTRRPTFHWTLPTGLAGARVEICTEAECVSPTVTFDASGDHGAPPVDLDPGIAFWRVCLPAGVGDACSPYWWSFTVPRRSAPHDTSYGIRPDLDGDGDSDLVIGQPGEPGSNSGLVGAWVGGPDGPMFAAWNQPRLGSVLITPNHGRSVTAAGSMLGTGGIAIVSGSAGNAYVTQPRIGFNNEPDDDMFGNGDHGFAFAVAGAGDVDGDGYADVLIGLADDSDEAVGAFALVFYGGARRDSHGYGRTDGDPSERFGRSLSGAGDVDGDGLADVIVGAPGANRAYLFQGQPSRPPSREPIVLQGPSGTYFGSSVACAGDVNGDGLSDVIVGASLGDRAFVYLGDETRGLLVDAPIELAVAAAVAGDFGASVSGAGDVDGDGYGDVVVGAPSAELGYGRAYVFSGGPSGPGADPSAVLVSTDASGADFGRAVAGVGDVDLDGFDDVAVGIPGALEALRGAVDVFRGATGGLVTTRAWRLEGHDMGYVGFGAAIARAL